MTPDIFYRVTCGDSVQDILHAARQEGIFLSEDKLLWFNPQLAQGTPDACELVRLSPPEGAPAYHRPAHEIDDNTYPEPWHTTEPARVVEPIYTDPEDQKPSKSKAKPVQYRLSEDDNSPQWLDGAQSPEEEKTDPPPPQPPASPHPADMRILNDDEACGCA